MKRAVFTGLFLACLLVSSRCLAWGERGHHVVAEVAARVLGSLAPGTEGGADLAGFFVDRQQIMGHLSYAPDSTWRNTAQKPRIARRLAFPTTTPERLLGAPEELEGSGLEAYLEKVRQLPPDYEQLKRRYEGTENPLPEIYLGPTRLPGKLRLGLPTEIPTTGLLSYLSATPSSTPKCHAQERTRECVKGNPLIQPSDRFLRYHVFNGLWRAL